MALTPEQKTVFDWLNTKLNLPVFAEAYKGAWHLLGARMPGYITLVSHIGRDLMNILAPLTIGIERSQVQYQQRVNQLQDKWKDEWGGPGLLPHDDPGSGHLIPFGTCQLIAVLIDEHKAGTERNAQADAVFFSTFLDYDEFVRIPNNLIQEWKSARRWFLSHAHLRQDPHLDDDGSKTEGHFQALHNLLFVAATSEFGRLKAIDDILEQANR